MRSVSVLGSTGSIGTQALDVLQGAPERFRVAALSAQTSTDLLLAQAALLRPDLVVIGDPSRYAAVRDGVPSGTEVMAGPEGLLAAAEQHCAAWPAGALHLERFAAKPQSEPAAGPGQEAPFEVVCQRSGLTVTVPPGQSIIDALEENGVSVLSSCLEGVCGTCETAVLEGVPDHRDSLLSEEEREANEYMMICVGRSKSDRLVLDL